MTITGDVPATAVSGSYGYKLTTSGWPVAALDSGASINMTVYPPTPPPAVAPTVTIHQPTQLVWTLNAPGTLSIPFEFQAVSSTAAVITNLAANLDGNGQTGVSQMLTKTNLNTASATGTGTLSIIAGGTYTLHCLATNDVGTSEANVTFVVNVNAAAPTVEITNPPSDGHSFAYGTAAVAITGTSGLDKYLVLSATLNPGARSVSLSTSKPAPNSLTTYGSASLANLPPGSYSLTATATDRLGVSSSTTRSFTVGDPAKPVVTISSPANNASFLLGTPVNFVFSATSYTGGAPIAVTGTVDGGGPIALPGSASGSTFSGTYLRSDLSLGAHTFTVTAMDSWNRLSVPATVTVNIVGAPPCAGGWLPPISLDKPFQGGAKVPVKFTLDCGDGVTKDTSITVVVSEKVGNAKPVVCAFYTYDNGRTPTDSYTIAGNGQYQVNFPTAKGVHTYFIEVFRGSSEVPVMSKVITTK